MADYTHERLLFDSKENHPWFGWQAKTNHMIPRGGAVRIDIPASQDAGELYVTPEVCNNATDRRTCLGYAPETIPADDTGFIAAGGNCTYLNIAGTLTQYSYLMMSTVSPATFEATDTTPPQDASGMYCGMVMTDRTAITGIGHGVIWPMRV